MSQLLRKALIIMILQTIHEAISSTIQINPRNYSIGTGITNFGKDWYLYQTFGVFTAPLNLQNFTNTQLIDQTINLNLNYLTQFQFVQIYRTKYIIARSQTNFLSVCQIELVSTTVFVVISNYTSNFTIRRLFSVENSEIFYGITSENKLLSFNMSSTTYNLTPFETSFFSTEDIFDMDCNQDYIVILTRNYSTNNGGLYIYSTNLTFFKKQIILQFNFTAHKSLRLGKNYPIFLLTSQTKIQVWNFNLIIQVTQTYPLTINIRNAILDAIICNGLIFSLQNAYVRVYEMLTTRLIYNQSVTENVTKIFKSKCYQLENRIGYKLNTSSASKLAYIDFIYTFSPNVINSTKIQLSAAAEAISKMNEVITNQILSNESKSASALAGSIAGVASATSITRPILRPLINVMEDLWFYGFHSKVYPDFVELFTKEVDVLNELRIKPQFLDYKVELPKVEEGNEKLKECQLLQDRAPEAQFMLQSVKDIYTTNFAMTIASFFFIKLLCLCLRRFRRFRVLNSIYCFLEPGTLWWSLMIAFCESNVTPVTFYGSVQFNAFVSFDFFSKLNLFVAAAFFFGIMSYVFLFYPFIFRFGSGNTREKVSEFGDGVRNTFWLQMSLKCFRAFFQSLCHGMFINRHLFQLLSLIMLDTAMLTMILRLRKMFLSKAVLFSTFLFYLIFLSFDVSLLLYTIDEQRSADADVTYNLVFIIIILSLIAVSILKILIAIIQLIIQLVKHSKVKNKILSQQIKVNKIQNPSEASPIQIKKKVIKLKKPEIVFNFKQSQEKWIKEIQQNNLNKGIKNMEDNFNEKHTLQRNLRKQLFNESLLIKNQTNKRQIKNLIQIFNEARKKKIDGKVVFD